MSTAADESQSWTAMASDYVVICQTRFNFHETSKIATVSTYNLYTSIYLSIVRLDRDVTWKEIMAKRDVTTKVYLISL
jgi:hypothetical protein